MPFLLGASGRVIKPSDRIGLGIVGYGIRARNLLSRFLNSDEVMVVGVAEVVDERRDLAIDRINTHYGNQTARGHRDFRELIARPDVDAIMVTTPDHWHATPAIEACRAGKHVYCEKPLSLTVAEGRAIANAARISGVAFQTGSQQRSEYGGNFVRAAEAVRNGRLGTLQRITCAVGDPPKPCDLPAEELPAGIDWTMWNGPAPERPFSSVLCPIGMHKHYPAWRNYSEYANGGLGDFGAHHFDIAQWAMDMDDGGPRRVLPPEGDGTRGLRFQYENGVELEHGGDAEVRFEGSDGWIEAGRGYLRVSNEEIVNTPLGRNEVELPRSPSHIRDWIAAMTSGTPTVANAETGHRTASLCQLAVIGYDVRAPLDWDPISERFRGTDASRANLLLGREPNQSWAKA